MVGVEKLHHEEFPLPAKLPALILLMRKLTIIFGWYFHFPSREPSRLVGRSCHLVSGSSTYTHVDSPSIVASGLVFSLYAIYLDLTNGVGRYRPEQIKDHIKPVCSRILNLYLRNYVGRGR